MASFTTLPEEMKIKILRTSIKRSEHGKYFTAVGDYNNSLSETGARSSEAMRTVVSLCRVSKDFKRLTTEAVDQEIRELYAFWTAASSATDRAMAAVERVERPFIHRVLPGLCLLVGKIDDQYTATMGSPDTSTCCHIFLQHWLTRTLAFEDFCRRSAPAEVEDYVTFMELFSKLNVAQANLLKETFKFLTMIPELAERARHKPISHKLSTFGVDDFAVGKRGNPPRDSVKAQLTASALEALFEDDQFFSSELAQRGIRVNLILKRGRPGDKRQVSKAIKVINSESIDEDDDSDDVMNLLLPANAPAITTDNQSTDVVVNANDMDDDEAEWMDSDEEMENTDGDAAESVEADEEVEDTDCNEAE